MTTKRNKRVSKRGFSYFFCKKFDLFRNSAKRIYLFEIKRVRRITSFWGNELATVLIAVVCIALLVWVTLTDTKVRIIL